MSSEDPSADEARLLCLVPEGGSAIGNNRLRAELGWDVAHYFEVRTRLLQKKALATRRGRGGSVYRVGPTVVVKGGEDRADAQVRQYGRESELYAPVSKALEEGWSNALSHHDYLVQVTAGAGKKGTGGMWTRPDITVVVVESYAYVPGKYLDVITYEVKPAGSWNVAGVFEAASHSRFATQTFLLMHAPDGKESMPEEELERVQRECARFEIGLGLFRDPGSYETYDFLVDPERRHPDPAEMNRFISQQLSDANRRLISAWLH